jgi:hypothetical protein
MNKPTPVSSTRERPISTKEAGILLKQIRKAEARSYLNGADQNFLRMMAFKIRPGFCVSERQRFWLDDILRRARVHRDPRRDRVGSP